MLHTNWVSLLRWLGFSLLVVLVAGCSQGSSSPPPAAEKPKVESELARTTLSPQACKSLGIHCEAISTKPGDAVVNRLVQEHVHLTGWIMVRQGNEVTLTAPVAGYLRDPAPDRRPPVVGEVVQQGVELFRLEPVLSPLEQVQLAALKRGVESELAKARESVLAADSQLKRVDELVKSKLKSDQELEEARVRAKHAREDLAAAEDKRKLFTLGGGNGESAALPPVAIRAPRGGTVLTVQASPGQYLPASAPLLTLADLSELWVRVPVPEHYLPQLDPQRPVKITVKGANSATAVPKAAPTFDARPVALVPQVDTTKHTADMIYQLTTPAGRATLAKDQMVTVFIPLGRQREETVVPYSAVIFDAYAGSWIYLDRTPNDAKEHLYERRRVELGPSVEGGVVVRPKCKPGERVVVQGAAFLFSREFHVPPVPSGTKQDVDDDD